MFGRRISSRLMAAALFAASPMSGLFAQQAPVPVPVAPLAPQAPVPVLVAPLAPQAPVPVPAAPLMPHAPTLYRSTAKLPAPTPGCVLKVYHVADLVVPIPRTVGTKNTPTDTPPVKTTEAALIKLITGAISPQTWNEMGGRGSIDYHPMTMSLVVNQTPDVQERIADLLSSLRRVQDVQVALEVRLIDVTEDFFERIGVDFSMNIKADKEQVGQAVVVPQPAPQAKCDLMGAGFLTDKQVAQLLETVQGDQRTNIVQAPKMIVANGQQASLSVCDQQNYVTDVTVHKQGDQTICVPKNEAKKTGLEMTVQPVVSADRRHVQVYVKVNHTQLGSAQVPLFPIAISVKPQPEGGSQGQPVVFTQFIQQPSFCCQTLEKTVAIPDGGTVCLGGLKRIIETRHEYGPPVLSKVPYVNRLFKNVGYGRENHSLLVLVTPRILSSKEIESVKQQPTSAPQTAVCPPCCPSVAPATPATPVNRVAQVIGYALKKPGSEEAQTECCETKTCPTTTKRSSKAIEELVKAYESACAEGRVDEAEKLARAVLILDPTCFSKSRR